MEINLLKLSVTEAAEVTDVCSMDMRSPVCPMTQIGTILIPSDALAHKKLFHKMFSKTASPGTQSSLNAKTDKCLCS